MKYHCVSNGITDELILDSKLVQDVNELIRRIVSQRHNADLASRWIEHDRMSKFYKGERVTL